VLCYKDFSWVIILLLNLLLLGLYDKPVVIEGKRARKSTEFLVNQTTPAINKEAKPLFFEVKISIKLSYMYLSGIPGRILKH